MLMDGLIDEARFLRDNGLLSKEMAQKIVGYREAYDYLEAKTDMEQMLTEFQRSTRNYAKRQLTWFRQHSTGPKHDISDNMLIEGILRNFR